jgi:Xaa-Pro aminopeptidase
MRTARLRRLLVAGLLAALCSASAAAADELTDDLVARRALVMQRLGSSSMLLLWSAPPRNYSLDVHYGYRQDSNLYYLTGITQSETMLVLMPGNTTHREILFIRDKDPAREHWNGRLLSHEEAAARSGIRTVLSNTQFEAFVAAMLNRTAFSPIDERESASFAQAVVDGRASIALALDARGLNDPPTRALDFARRVRDGYAGVTITNVLPILTELRLVKSPYEQRMLARSLEISGEAQRAGMKAARPGRYEFEVKAAVEAVHVAKGAVGWSFPSIVGSGPNTTILHNPHADRQIQDGDLVLVDAAANYEYLAGDLTRTYPANGRFTPVQREVYELVLAAQEAGIDAAVPGATLMDVHRKAADVLRHGLLRLGLITDASGEQYRMWFTHGAVHYLGIDVHDVGDNHRPLQPGMAFVIEPGIYVRQAALDALPRSAEHDAFIAAVQPAVSRYRDIGVRIEDAFILEAGGLRRLTTGVPRTVEEIEAFFR